MGITNFDTVYSNGALLSPNGLPMTRGRYIFVDADNGSDTNDGKTMDTAVKTVAQGYSLATTNKDDVIVLSTNAVHTLTAMLTVSKNRVHFVGDPYGRMYGQRARINMGVTTAVTDVHMIKNIGIGNTFTGIKFMSDNTLTQNTSCVGEGGEYAVYRNCEFYDSTRLNSDTHAEVLLNGDSTQFFNCTFGSLADSVSGDKVRPAVITTLGGVANSLSGGYCRDILFDGCRFWKNAGGTTTAMVQITADTIERIMEFHNCQFIANHLGSTPAVAVASAATLTVGLVLLSGDTSALHCTKIATATGIFSALNAKVATATIGIQTT